MTSTAARVRRVIEESGLTQGEFARHVGLDAPKLSKSLSGVRRFTSLDLARIGELSGRSVEWLLGGDEPPLAMAARAALGTSTGTATEIAHDLTDVRSSLTGLGFPQRVTLPARPDLSGLDYEQGAQLALVALDHLAAQGVSAANDLPGAVESAFGIDVAILPLGENVDGLAASTPAASLILAAPTAIPYRQRFTIAHELGHLLAGDDQELHVDEDIFGARSKAAGSERRANAFAAAFLMPVATLREAVGDAGLDEVGFCRLALDLQVSPAALAWRLSSLGLIDGMALARFKAISSKRAATRCHASTVLVEQAARSSAPRPPGLLARDAFTAYEQGFTTLRLYARVLGEQNTERLRASLEDGDGASRRQPPSVDDMRAFFESEDTIKAPL